MPKVTSWALLLKTDSSTMFREDRVASMPITCRFRQCQVRAGDWVLLSPWITHRRPDFWPDPECFDPDRFAPEKIAARHRYAWVPFSAGQRKCIGDQFALMEARLILITVLQRWKFSSAPGHVAKKEPLLTLRPQGGMPMVLERRQSR